MVNTDVIVQRFYKVFISSTFRDLSVYRQEAVLAILNAGHMPVALEHYAPENDSKRQVISDALSGCQYYVIILGANYGTIPPDQHLLPDNLKNKSYTEIELELALEAGLPVLAFIMDKDEVEKRRITKDWIDSGEPAKLDMYKALHARLTDGICKPFYKPFSKEHTVYSELYSYFNKPHPKTLGYILEPSIGSNVDLILRFSSANKVARDVVEALGKFSDVDPRLEIFPEKKDAIARAFLDLHGNTINQFSSIFFESGSTITYLVRTLANSLPTHATPLYVSTNNAFAYLYLWLCSGVMCHPVPEGPPDHTYGGMYGPLTNLSRSPNYNLPPLEKYDSDAADLIKSLAKQVFSDSVMGKNSLLIAAASGLQLTDNVVIKQNINNNWVTSTNQTINERICKCRGFHVGSYPNMLFKRCYYLTGIPTIVLIHDTKIDCEVKVEKCHFLFDQGTPWEDFTTNYPLCIWIACDQATYLPTLSKCEQHFIHGNWSFFYYGESNLYPIIIGHNRKFREDCKRLKIRILEK